MESQDSHHGRCKVSVIQAAVTLLSHVARLSDARARQFVVLTCTIVCTFGGISSSLADEAAVAKRIKELGGNATSEGSGTDSPIVRVYIPGGNVSDEDLKILRELPDLRELSLSGQTGKSPPTRNGRVTDAGMREIAGLTKLESLVLAGNRISNDGLKELRSLERLRHLDLSMTSINDDGLQELVALTKLETVRIWDVRITDAGLVHLRKIKSLKRIHLAHARVTEGGLQLTREAIPGIKVENSEYGR